MSAAEAIATFPRRPLRLAATPGRTINRILLFGLSVAAAIPAAYWSVTTFQEGQLYARLKSHGVAGQATAAEGQCRAVRLRLTNDKAQVGCDLDVTYRTAQEQGDRTFTSRVRYNGSDRNFPVDILYDPEAPDRAMLAQEVANGQGWTGYGIAGLLWLLALLPLILWRVVSQRGLAAAARSPRPVAVRVSHTVRVMPTNHLEVHFATASGKIVHDIFDRPHEPLLLPPPSPEIEPGNWALGLEGKNGRAHLLDRELRFLDLDENERRAVLAAAAR